MRLLLLWMSLIASITAIAQDLPTHTQTLDNGLTIVVREDHRAPVVTVQVWYKVGSSYEPTGLTGVSHLLEHMMFKGTPKHPDGEYANTITRSGGALNAFTSYDYTGYYASLPVTQLETVLALEADRMRNTTFNEEKFSKELQVVIEERRMRTDDVPESFAFERFQANALMHNTYRHPIIGWQDDLNHATLQASKDWYDTWYRPNNAIVVIVGDVTPNTTLTLVKKHFAQVPAKPVPSVRAVLEPKQAGEKRLDVHRQAQTPYFYMGFQVPSVLTQEEDWHAAALVLLSSILDGGESARLSQRIMREQAIANSAFADYSPFMRQDYLFLFGGMPQGEHTVADLEKALWVEIESLKNTLVSNEELHRAKAQFIAGDIYSMDSISTQANMIGGLEAVGLSYEAKEKLLKQIDKVTAKQLQAVAQLYLNRDNVTVATLVPTQGA